MDLRLRDPHTQASLSELYDVEVPHRIDELPHDEAIDWRESLNGLEVKWTKAEEVCVVQKFIDITRKIVSSVSHHPFEQGWRELHIILVTTDVNVQTR